MKGVAHVYGMVFVKAVTDGVVSHCGGDLIALAGRGEGAAGFRGS